MTSHLPCEPFRIDREILEFRRQIPESEKYKYSAEYEKVRIHLPSNVKFVTNCKKDKIVDFYEFGRHFVPFYSREQFNDHIFVGPPAATYCHSEESLWNSGLVGIYLVNVPEEMRKPGIEWDRYVAPPFFID